MLLRKPGMLLALLLPATGPLCALEKGAPLDIPNHSFERTSDNGWVEGWGIWNYFNKSNKTPDFTVKTVAGGKVGRSALRFTAETGKYYDYRNNALLLGGLLLGAKNYYAAEEVFANALSVEANQCFEFSFWLRGTPGIELTPEIIPFGKDGKRYSTIPATPPTVTVTAEWQLTNGYLWITHNNDIVKAAPIIWMRDEALAEEDKGLNREGKKGWNFDKSMRAEGMTRKIRPGTYYEIDDFRMTAVDLSFPTHSELEKIEVRPGEAISTERLIEQAIPSAYHYFSTAQKTRKVQTEYLDIYKAEYEKANPHRMVYLPPDGRRQVAIWIVSPAARGDTYDSLRSEKLWYNFSTDSGRTWCDPRPIMQEGAEFNALHPFRHLHLPYNAAQSTHAAPVVVSNGDILFPFSYVQLNREDPQKHYMGKYYHTVTGNAVLIAKWPEGSDAISWDCSEGIEIDEEVSTRGLCEMAVIEIKAGPGTLFSVHRGSNVGKPIVPAYKWKSVSYDYGRTWSKPVPLTYDTGERFFSSATCMNLLRHTRNGKLFIILNISGKQCSGNFPRYPLYLAEIDETTLTVRKDSLRVIDTRRDGQSAEVQYSNMLSHEDRDTGEIVVRLSIYDVDRKTRKRTGEPKTYRLQVQ